MLVPFQKAEMILFGVEVHLPEPKTDVHFGALKILTTATTLTAGIAENGQIFTR